MTTSLQSIKKHFHFFFIFFVVILIVKYTGIECIVEHVFLFSFLVKDLK